MIHAFIDASVLISACLSTKGASHEIIRESLRGNVTLVVSDVVLEETERNLSRLPHRASEALIFLKQLLNVVHFEFVEPTKHQVIQAAEYTALKDAPIVAAARRAKVDCLVSLDRRHLVGISEVAQRAGLKIILPEELLEEIRRQKRQNLEKAKKKGLD